MKLRSGKTSASLLSVNDIAKLSKQYAVNKQKLSQEYLPCLEYQLQMSDDERKTMKASLINNIKEQLHEPVQYKVVFDLDAVMIEKLRSECSNTTKDYLAYQYPESQLLTIENDVYLLHPNFDLVILTILSWKHWTVDFFSSAPFERNIRFVESFFNKILAGSNLTFPDLRRSRRFVVSSRQHMVPLLEKPLETWQQQTPETEWVGIKDLRSIAGDLNVDNTILIDDNHRNVHPSQMPYIHIATRLDSRRSSIFHNLRNDLEELNDFTREFDSTLETLSITKFVQDYINTNQLSTSEQITTTTQTDIDCAKQFLLDLIHWKITTKPSMPNKIYSSLLNASYTLGIIVACKHMMEKRAKEKSDSTEEGNTHQMSLREALHTVLQRNNPPYPVQDYWNHRFMSYYNEQYYSCPCHEQDSEYETFHYDCIDLGNTMLRSLLPPGLH